MSGGARPARPPLAVVLRYRLLGRRPDAAHDEWVRADLDGRWFPVRFALSAAGPVVALLLVAWWAAGTFGWWTPPEPAVAVAVAVLVVAADVVRGTRRGAIRERLFGDQREVGHFQPYVHLDGEG